MALDRTLFFDLTICASSEDYLSSVYLTVDISRPLDQWKADRMIPFNHLTRLRAAKYDVSRA